jgi:hypothetical protein
VLFSSLFIVDESLVGFISRVMYAAGEVSSNFFRMPAEVGGKHDVE